MERRVPAAGVLTRSRIESGSLSVHRMWLWSSGSWPAVHRRLCIVRRSCSVSEVVFHGVH